MKYDVIVVGGGPAGIGAAYTAAKSGAKTLLVERYGRLGGMATLALVNPFMGQVESKIVKEVIDHIGGMTVDLQRVDLQLYDLLNRHQVDVLLHASAVDVLRNGNKVTGVLLRCREGLRSVLAHTIIDASGDGDIAAQAGIPFAVGREQDQLTQPMSIMFLVAGIDPTQRFCCGSEAEARRKMVGDRSWADIVLESRAKGELPDTIGIIRLYAAYHATENIINATQVNRLSGINSRDLTIAELEGRRQAFIVLDYMKNHLPGYENAYISCMPALIGVRETRRFEGLACLEKADCVAGRQFPDAIVRSAKFSIDIHNPDGFGQAAGHDQHQAGEAEKVQPYQIPYRTLVPRKVDGLLLAGRCISASHEALASCRVMCIAMATGAAAGAAAAYASQHQCLVREVPVEKLAATLFV